MSKHEEKLVQIIENSKKGYLNKRVRKRDLDAIGRMYLTTFENLMDDLVARMRISDDCPKVRKCYIDMKDRLHELTEGALNNVKEVDVPRYEFIVKLQNTKKAVYAAKLTES